MEFYSKYDKYIHGGGLNPYWVRDQELGRLEYDARKEAESLEDTFCELLEAMIPNGSNNNTTTSSESYEDKLETQFRFLKRHSGNEEDARIARQILGLD